MSAIGFFVCEKIKLSEGLHIKGSNRKACNRVGNKSFTFCTNEKNIFNAIFSNRKY